MIKLNESFSGEGNAVVRLPTDPTADLKPAMDKLELSIETETPDSYFAKFAAWEASSRSSSKRPRRSHPSAQFRTSPRGEVLSISTHDQILGGPNGQVYLGCRFPADSDYRLAITEMGDRVGRVLTEKGVVSRYGVDFLAYRDHFSEPWKLTALEINLRMLGTTHPFLALRFLTGGELDNKTGQFISLGGRAKFYRATDNLRSERYRTLLPEDLIDVVTDHELHYSHRTESGALFHLIGALSEFGKLGVTVIANSTDEADEVYNRVMQVLDAETVYGS